MPTGKIDFPMGKNRFPVTEAWIYREISENSENEPVRAARAYGLAADEHGFNST